MVLKPLCDSAWHVFLHFFFLSLLAEARVFKVVIDDEIRDLGLLLLFGDAALGRWFGLPPDLLLGQSPILLCRFNFLFRQDTLPILAEPVKDDVVDLNRSTFFHVLGIV